MRDIVTGTSFELYLDFCLKRWLEVTILSNPFLNRGAGAYVLFPPFLMMTASGARILSGPTSLGHGGNGIRLHSSIQVLAVIS